jgi:hypothetical protein
LEAGLFRRVEAAAWEWLQQLARLLPLSGIIDARELKHELPVPPVVVDYYGSFTQFIKATPGLRWEYPGHAVGLNPAFHRVLRQPEAPAAGATAASADRWLPARQVQTTQARVWLQQLALLLPYARGGAVACLHDLRTDLPVPDAVWRQYGSVTAFVDATPGLSWAGSFDIRLDPGLHSELLREVGGSGGY